ncbi:unnamed protein product [Boreogadus saida]
MWRNRRYYKMEQHTVVFGDTWSPDPASSPGPGEDPPQAPLLRSGLPPSPSGGRGVPASSPRGSVPVALSPPPPRALLCPVGPGRGPGRGATEAGSYSLDGRRCFDRGLTSRGPGGQGGPPACRCCSTTTTTLGPSIAGEHEAARTGAPRPAAVGPSLSAGEAAVVGLVIAGDQSQGLERVPSGGLLPERGSPLEGSFQREGPLWRAPSREGVPSGGLLPERGAPLEGSVQREGPLWRAPSREGVPSGGLLPERGAPLEGSVQTEGTLYGAPSREGVPSVGLRPEGTPSLEGALQRIPSGGLLPERGPSGGLLPERGSPLEGSVQRGGPLWRAPSREGVPSGGLLPERGSPLEGSFQRERNLWNAGPPRWSPSSFRPSSPRESQFSPRKGRDAGTALLPALLPLSGSSSWLLLSQRFSFCLEAGRVRVSGLLEPRGETGVAGKDITAWGRPG